MSEFSAGFKLYADSSQFERGMAQAVRTAQDAGKKVERAFGGKEIATALAAGLGFSLNSVIEDVSKKIARLWIGFTEDQEAALEATIKAGDKAADAQEKALERLREKKQRDLDASVSADQKALDMIRDLKEKAAEEDAEKRKKESEAKKDAIADVASFDEKARFAKLSDEQKLISLRKEDANLSKIISGYEADVKKNGFDNSESARALLELKQAQADVQGKIKDLTTATAVQETKTADAVEKQLTAKMGIAGIRGAGQFSEASDSALRESIRRNESQIEGFGQIRNIGQNLEIARLRAEISNIKKELNFRSELQGNVARLGIEGARRQFGGDPLAFDRLVQQYVSDARTMKDISAQTNELLRQMNERQKSGLPVVNLNL